MEGNPVFIYHDTFNPNTAEVEDLKARCREGKVGDVEVKTKLAAAINTLLEPIRERREQALARPGYIRGVDGRLEKGPRGRPTDDGARPRSREAEILMADAPDTPGGGAAAEEPFESQLESIRIKLQSFEGPLNLLVHLIKKHQINVYDIPISLVTKQYLEPLDLLQELNLDVASEFLVMAATLIHIKSKMLLPRPETAAGDPGEEEDPRDALVRRLLEHQKFKAAAELLHEKETLRSAQWGRPDARIEELAGDDYEPESRSTCSACCRRSSRCSSGRASGRQSTCRRSRFQSRCGSSSCSAGCLRPTRAGSRTCSTTSPPAPT